MIGFPSTVLIEEDGCEFLFSVTNEDISSKEDFFVKINVELICAIDEDGDTIPIEESE